MIDDPTVLGTVAVWPAEVSCQQVLRGWHLVNRQEHGRCILRSGTLLKPSMTALGLSTAVTKPCATEGCSLGKLRVWVLCFWMVFGSFAL